MTIPLERLYVSTAQDSSACRQDLQKAWNFVEKSDKNPRQTCSQPDCPSCRGIAPQSASRESGDLAATVVYILTTPWPEGMTGEQVQVDVGYLLDWVTTNTSSAERQVLAVQLQDPNLTFADATVEELVPSIVQSLVE